jgi:hypothetical protein
VANIPGSSRVDPMRQERPRRSPRQVLPRPRQ